MVVFYFKLLNIAISKNVTFGDGTKLPDFHVKFEEWRRLMNVIELPFVKKVGVQNGNDGKLMLPFKEDLCNHIQTIHAAAQFTLAETSSGEILQELFPDLADKVIPVLRDSQIKFRKPAKSIIYAFPSVSGESRSKFEEQFNRNGRGFISVDVEVKDSEGVVTCTGTFTWFVQSL